MRRAKDGTETWKAITSLTPDERLAINDLRAIEGRNPLPNCG
ncbi:hypothetical protein [Isoptericola croceus]|nr:hypothetical protein [Isoptericola croceus]